MTKKSYLGYCTCFP